jgi:HSP20 family molecular chaperone IbpA
MARPGWSKPDPLASLQGELNRIVEHYWPAWAPNLPFTSSEERSQVAWVPAVDLYETGDEVVIEVDLPGVDPGAIDLTVDGRVLTLRGEKPESGGGEGSGRSARERRFGAFLRQVMLPSEVDITAVKAQARNGVLTVRLPKSETARVRQVPIQPA